MIPNPPNHCDVARQRIRLFGRFWIDGKIERPVVVNPETDSKNAFIQLVYGRKGMEEMSGTTMKDTAVRRIARAIVSGWYFPMPESTNRAIPKAKVIVIDARNPEIGSS